ncbi:MAG: hypothetical protein LBK29_04025 [Oscillospiraceae bacterium]|nr:hypothetical protein [Oscillospiraceae bacterium]
MNIFEDVVETQKKKEDTETKGEIAERMWAASWLPFFQNTKMGLRQRRSNSVTVEKIVRENIVEFVF